MRENIGIVPNDPRNESCDQADQIPECDCAEPRHDADHQGEQGEKGSPMRRLSSVSLKAALAAADTLDSSGIFASAVLSEGWAVLAAAPVVT